MSLFAQGLDRTRRRRLRIASPGSGARRRRLRVAPAGSAVGVLVWTPGMVQSYMDQTNAGIVSTGQEIHAWLLRQNREQPGRTADWQHLNAAWGKFVANWSVFYKKGSARLWGGFQDVQRAHAWRLKLIEWRKIFASHGLKFLGAGPVVRIPGRDVLRDVLIGATGAAAAGVVTYYTMKLFRKKS